MITDNVEIESKQISKIRRDMSHWVKVAEIIYAEDDENEILKLLKVELNGPCRPYMVHRVYSRYNALRSKREKKELSECLNQKKQ